jgi:hypothetical protein
MSILLLLPTEIQFDANVQKQVPIGGEGGEEKGVFR